MPVVLVRIDDRLIHGQVVEAWIPALKAQRVLVVSDEAAGDSMQQALMRLAMPDSVELEIHSLKQASAAVQAAASCKERVLVLTPGPQEALALLNSGVSMDTVNVGGLHYAAGRIQLGKAVFLGEEDLRALKAIADLGVRLEGRSVPTETPSDVMASVRAHRL